MPYEIQPRDGQFCVVKQGTDKTLGCHPTKAKARRQMAALYANEPAAKASAEINDLPDSAFAYIEPGGSKDDGGKTVPRSLRHFPIHDKAHVRNALARLSGSPFEAKARPKVEAAARKFGIGEPAAEAAKGSVAAMHAEQGADILSDLYCLIGCEADEPDQLAMLQRAVDAVNQWLDAERREIGGPDDATDDYAMTDAYPKARLHRPGEKDTEVKAEGLTEKQMESWLAGERARRIVVVPFYGPLPGGKAGLDLDGEYFDAETDIYGPFPGLRATRERLVDWHHDDAGTPEHLARMKGAILGKIVLDEGPSTLTTDDGEFDGILADFWANAGERRVALIRDLQRRKVPLYGSSQAVAKAVRIESDGHISLWPLYRHTITTSPQNTYAVVPPLKAVLTADLPFDEVGLAALKAALVGLEDLSADLHATSRGGERAAKARRLSAVLSEGEQVLARLRTRIQSQTGVHIQ